MSGSMRWLAKPVSIELLYQRFVNIVTRQREFIKAKGYFGPCRRRQTKDYQGPEKRGQEQVEDEDLEIPEVSDFEAA